MSPTVIAREVKYDDIGKTVAFDVYPTATLGTTFDRVKLVAILDYEAANQYINVPVLAANVYATLPAGTLKDFTKYLFLKVILPDGKTTAVAVQWIDMTTYRIFDSINIDFTIENASGADVERIRKILASNGFTAVNFNITD